jgi:hypothetical protein
VSVPRFLELPPLLTLHTLPRAFTDLYTMGGAGACCCCGMVPVEPAVCLLCGKTLCLSRCKPRADQAVQTRACELVSHTTHGDDEGNDDIC